ncbi:MAG TPA: HpcH/HpaI aldolase/citrate lyase family protein [Rhizomicrobium sp.]|nr:HpcH/HpaI aldolase/citrate lyase family protein [Rhizomicrobium sp.]
MNRLKAALARHQLQVGLWQTLANPYTAEICASTGFDWLLFDGEHSPNTIQTMLSQLQAVSGYPVDAMARPPVGDPRLIKQYLDIGFRSLLIPMVGSAAEARLLVSATRFPTEGIRGVASLTRAAGFGTRADYFAEAHDDICLVLQIESKPGLEAIADIASVEGVDALFIGPGDLAGALGHLGNPSHPKVQSAISNAIETVRKTGKAAGIFATSIEAAKRYADAGASLISVGTDIGLLVSGARSLVDALKGSSPS